MMKNKFFEDLKSGLLTENKFIPSKYFYDDKGSALFEEITYLDEYYLTRLEKEILVEKLPLYIEGLGLPSFNLVEIGAGDGQKSVALIKKLYKRKKRPHYFALDISQKALDKLESRLQAVDFNFSYRLLCADYEEGLDQIAQENDDPSFILFLGSSIGNFSFQDSIAFLNILKNKMDPKDTLIIGFDLIKDKKILELAYNDPGQLTARFNLNLLERINREAGANFHLDLFEHLEFFNPQDKRMESYLVSRAQQTVEIDGVGTVKLEKGERILTEYSYKYDDESISNISVSTGLKKEWQGFDATRGYTLVAFKN